MAKILQAVRDYGPKLELGPTAQLDEVVARILQRISLNKTEVTAVLTELSEMLLEFNARGVPVKLPGVGIFRPTVGRSGELRIKLAPDQALRNGINAADVYKGRILNRERIDLDDAGYKELWDADHPQDPLEV